MRSAITALGLALPLAAAKVSYQGYQAFHIDAVDNYDDVAKAIKEINYVSMSCESNHKSFDIAVAPESLDAFKQLGLDASVVNEDLGADIEAEARFVPYVGMFVFLLLPPPGRVSRQKQKKLTQP